MRKLLLVLGLLPLASGVGGYFLIKYCLLPLTLAGWKFCQEYLHLDSLRLVLVCLVAIVGLLIIAPLMLATLQLIFTVIRNWYHTQQLRESKKLVIPQVSAPVYMVSAPNPFAYCSGWWQPKIIISSALIELCSKDELDLVLQHEYCHIQQRDVFFEVLSRFMTSGLPFVPLLGDLTRSYRLQRELEADQYALDQAGQNGNSDQLLGVLRKLLLIKTDQVSQARVWLADSETLVKRIQVLQGKSKILPLTSDLSAPSHLAFNYQSLLFSLAALVLIIALLMLPLQSTISAQLVSAASHQNSADCAAPTASSVTTSTTAVTPPISSPAIPMSLPQP
jgi:hypothetical protein